MGATRTAPALRPSLAERAPLTRSRYPPIVIAIGELRYIVYRNVLDLPRVAVTLARVSEIR